MNETEYSIKMQTEFEQCSMYVNAGTILSMNLREELKMDFACKPRGTIWIESTQFKRISR
jgi:hypothetical protein